MKISREDVANVALLSRLQFNDAELDNYTGKLNCILDYVHMLNKVNTDDIEPTIHVLPLKNVMKKDEVAASMDKQAAFANAPEELDGYFKVPKIMED